MLSAETRFAIRSDEIAFKVLDGETIIINLVNGMYYSLPGVGSEAWEMFDAGRTLGEVTARISERYSAPPVAVAADLARLAEELLAENLLSPDAGSAPARELPAPAPADRAYTPPALQTYRDMADLLALDPPTPGILFRPGAAESPDAMPG
ncbi:MAG TPA: PqqD family protein [Gemmatimonadales bacterium]